MVQKKILPALILVIMLYTLQPATALYPQQYEDSTQTSRTYHANPSQDKSNEKEDWYSRRMRERKSNIF